MALLPDQTQSGSERRMVQAGRQQEFSQEFSLLFAVRYETDRTLKAVNRLASPKLPGGIQLPWYKDLSEGQLDST
jgi:hypothetical protein